MRVCVGCLVAVVTYQVDLMMLVEDYRAVLGHMLLLLLGVHALILKTHAQKKSISIDHFYLKPALCFIRLVGVSSGSRGHRQFVK